MIGLLDDQAASQRQLILASGSPRRRDLLKAAGLTFEIISPDVEELGPGTLSPRDICLTNARLKATAISVDHPDGLIIGSDTIVVLGGQIYGKPLNVSEARENLRKFRGRVHEVMTAVSIIQGSQNQEFIETSYVKFHDFSDEVLEDYLTRVHVLDKAGGYAIQEHSELIVETIEGDYDNIVGLPVAKVLDHLAQMGFPLPR